MKILPKLSLGLAALLLVACGSDGSSGRAVNGTSNGPVTPPPAPQFEATGFESIDKGEQSPIRPATTEHRLITDLSTWTAFWQQHARSPVPSVDFPNQAVIASFLGEIGGNDNAIEVIKVEQDRNGSELRALVRTFRVASFKPNTKILVSPFHFVRCDTPAPAAALRIRSQQRLDFEVLSAGPNSAIGAGDPNARSQLLLFRDQAMLDDFWTRHAPGAAAPVIDFTEAMVIAVLAGYIPSFGNSVETRRIIHDDTSDEIRLEFRVNPYRGGAAPPPTTETPFQILKVSPSTGSLREETFQPAQSMTLAQGSQSLYASGPETLLIRDRQRFEQIWSSRIGGPVPSVDFQNEQVIAAFLGARPSPNFMIRVARLRLSEDGELLVTLNSAAFGSGGPPSQFDSPFHIVTMDRTKGPMQTETIDVTPAP